MSSEAKNNSIGLWVSESAKGTTYLKGTDKEAGLRYFIFKDDSGKRSLVSKPLDDNDAKLKPVATLEAAVSSKGLNYYKGSNGCAVFENEVEEGSNRPNFSLILADA
jgi:hypothetical protein